MHIYVGGVRVMRSMGGVVSSTEASLDQQKLYSFTD